MPERTRPRILILAHLPPPIHGVTVVNEALVNSRLLHERFRLHVLPMRFAREFSDIGSFRLSKFMAMASLAGRLAYRLLFHRPDAVYMTPTPAGPSFVRDALFLSIVNLFGVRKIIHLHGRGIRDAYKGSLFYRLLYRWAFWGAQVIHLSERLKSDVSIAVPVGNIHIVNNGVAAPLPPVAVDAPPRNGPPVLLYLSNLTPKKGVFVLLEALKLLSGEGIDFRAHLAGAPGAPQTMVEFRQACDETLLRGRVDYAGIVVGEPKDRLLRQSDIFVMPTLYDAFPLVALEAMAYALPVVCSEEGSLPDIVRDGETGVLVEKGNAPALAAALRPLLLDPERRRQMGIAGLRRYETNFTMGRMEESLAAVIDDCIGKFRHQAGG